MQSRIASALLLAALALTAADPAGAAIFPRETGDPQPLAAEIARLLPKRPPAAQDANSTGPRPVFLDILTEAPQYALGHALNVTVDVRAFRDVRDVLVHVAAGPGLAVEGPLVLGPIHLPDGGHARHVLRVNATAPGSWDLVISTATPDGRADHVRQEAIRFLVAETVRLVPLDTPEEEALPHASGVPSLHASTGIQSHGDFKSRRVMYVRGFDGGVNDPGADVMGDWWSTMDTLIRNGWVDDPDHHVRWGFYACDIPNSNHVDGYGSHLTHRFSPETGDHTLNYCGGITWKVDSHDRDTSIRHLAYHFAHAVTSTVGSECVVGVGYSMGGLILRYAAAKIGQADFPSSWCMQDIATFGAPHEGYDDSQWLNELCDGVHYQCDEMRPGSEFINWLRDNAASPPGDWTLMGSIGDGFVSEQSGSAANAMQNVEKVIFNENVEHTEYTKSGDEYHWKETTTDDITADLTRTDADGLTASTWDAPWPLRYVSLSLAYPDWGCGTYSSSSAWTMARGRTLHGEPFYSHWDCWYKVNVPAGEGELVVELRGILPVDRDLEVYSSFGGTLACGLYSGSSDETCVIANPSAGDWYVRVKNYAQTTDPFTIRAYTRVVHDLTSVYLTSYPGSVAANANYQVCWRVEGAGNIDHTNVHWSTRPGYEDYFTGAQAGVAPASFCETLTAPGSGTIYLKAHAYGPADDLRSGEVAIPVSGGGGGRVEIARHDGVIDSTGEYLQTGTFITFNAQGGAPVDVTYKYCYLANTNGRNAEIRTVFDGVVVNAKAFTTPYTGNGSCTHGVTSTYATHTVSLSTPVSSSLRFDWTNGDWRVSIADIVVTAAG